MRCAESRLLISKFVDGEATPTEVARLDEHLAHCRNCPAVLANYRRVNKQFAALVPRDPDPGGRARLMASLRRIDSTSPDEVPITRRQEISVMPAAAPARNWLNIFANMATAATVLIFSVLALLLWQAMNPNPMPNNPGPDSNMRPPATSPPSTIADGSSQDVPPAVATHVGPKTNADPRSPGVASPTGIWHALPEPTGVVNHTVRDARYGYSITYPRDWWTERFATSATSSYSQRLIQPWPLAANEERVETKVALKVHARADLSADNIATILGGDEPFPVSYNILEGVSSILVEANQHTESVYLFDDALTYEFTLTMSDNGRLDDGGIAGEWRAARDALSMMLVSFEPASVVDGDAWGAAPLLFLFNRNLWGVDPLTRKPYQITKDGTVRDFALSPDLSRVALITDISSNSVSEYGQRITIITLPPTAPTVINEASSVRDLAWLDDSELVAIGEGVEGFGIYRVAALLGSSAKEPITPLSNSLPRPRNLQVSPDRLWITFISGEGDEARLYRVSKDGDTPRELPVGPDKDLAVEDYGWLVPNADDGTARLVVLTEGMLGRLKVWPKNDRTPEWDVLDAEVDGRTLAISPEGWTAYATRSSDRAAIKLVSTTLEETVFPAAPTTYTPAGPTNTISALTWLPNSRYLAILEAGADGQPILRLFDREANSLAPLFSGKP